MTQPITYKVTLQANFARGVLYWVTDVRAASESEAIVAAENLFEAQLESGNDWRFQNFSVERA